MLSCMAATTSSPPPSSRVPAAAPLRRPTGAADIRRIAGASGKDERTVKATYAGLGAKESHEAIAGVAPALGFEPPPPRTK